MQNILHPLNIVLLHSPCLFSGRELSAVRSIWQTNKVKYSSTCQCITTPCQYKWRQVMSFAHSNFFVKFGFKWNKMLDMNATMKIRTSHLNSLTLESRVDSSSNTGRDQKGKKRQSETSMCPWHTPLLKRRWEEGSGRLQECINLCKARWKSGHTAVIKAAGANWRTLQRTPAAAPCGCCCCCRGCC